MFKSLILSAVSLGDAVIDPWMQATRYGRVDFAEVCCISDSFFKGALTSIGGRAVQYSHWNGLDLTTKARTDKLKENHFEKETASCVDDPSLCHTAHKTISIKIKVSSDAHEHSGRVSGL